MTLSSKGYERRAKSLTRQFLADISEPYKISSRLGSRRLGVEGVCDEEMSWSLWRIVWGWRRGGRRVMCYGEIWRAPGSVLSFSPTESCHCKVCYFHVDRRSCLSLWHFLRINFCKQQRLSPKLGMNYRTPKITPHEEPLLPLKAQNYETMEEIQ